MVSLVWGKPGERLYETGIDRGVFYPRDGMGTPWNGLIAVSETPSGADVTVGYYDGENYLQQRSSESFSGQIKAYSYPKEFEEYSGHFDYRNRGLRKPFGLSYRTKVINDQSQESYKIHLVYNVLVSPSDQSYGSESNSVNAVDFSWDFVTLPEFLPEGEFSAHLVIDTAIAYPWAIEALESILYGSAANDSRMPSIFEVVDLFENASILKITDNGDGTWTADGPEEAFNIVGDYFEITWKSAVYIDANRYKISSL